MSSFKEKSVFVVQFPNKFQWTLWCRSITRTKTKTNKYG